MGEGALRFLRQPGQRIAGPGVRRLLVGLNAEAQIGAGEAIPQDAMEVLPKGHSQAGGARLAGDDQGDARPDALFAPAPQRELQRILVLHHRIHHHNEPSLWTLQDVLRRRHAADARCGCVWVQHRQRISQRVARGSIVVHQDIPQTSGPLWVRPLLLRVRLSRRGCQARAGQSHAFKGRLWE